MHAITTDLPRYFAGIISILLSKWDRTYSYYTNLIMKIIALHFCKQLGHIWIRGSDDI